MNTLSNREQQVLTLIAQEHTTEQIAQKLRIGVPTVETHRRHLFQKMGVQSVVGLIKEAIKQGLVSLDPPDLAGTSKTNLEELC